MTHHDPDSPLLTILLSMGAGLATWLADPMLWRAASVALLCGVVGGMGKALGFWMGHAARKRWKKTRREP